MSLPPMKLGSKRQALYGIVTFLVVVAAYALLWLPAVARSRADELKQADAAVAQAAQDKTATFARVQATQAELEKVQDQQRSAEESPQPVSLTAKPWTDDELHQLHSTADWQPKLAAMSKQRLLALVESLLPQSWSSADRAQQMRSLKLAEAAAEASGSRALMEMVTAWTHAVAGFRAPSFKHLPQAKVLQATLSLQRVNLSPGIIVDQITAMHEAADASDNPLIQAAANLQLARAAASIPDPASQAQAIQKAQNLLKGQTRPEAKALSDALLRLQSGN
jgi:hypothetical protein